MNSPRRRGAVVGLLLGVALVAGCGIRTDDQPRAIPGAEPVVGAEVGGGAASGGTLRIYLVAPGDQRLLRSVPRSAPTAKDLIEILLDGPNEEEVEEGWISQIPADTQLLSLRTRSTTLFLDLTSELTALPATVQQQALAQIVYTAAEVEGVTGVQITFEGEPQPLPKGNGDATAGVLRPYDYPGFIQTSQPAYPALPTR
jgi:hypothetical protein